MEIYDDTKFSLVEENELISYVLRSERQEPETFIKDVIFNAANRKSHLSFDVLD
ncbi:hypothetical protein UFOVP150_30 [uncultured Caudovirales phage]|uniref:Uncharacterized protein n=1 Tax=uncultured Caudovirales phage TaxID=2100421 RepID=A0A6J7WCC3_9CAUD|nr:hypothetical protein UFOVP150_30 [uncultured Caudovirales phage]